MSRKRYLHTDISIDGAVNRLARNSGDFAALFYTWLIPHATDDGIVRGDEEKLILLVIPGRRDKKVADVTEALEGMEREGLIEWHRQEKEIWFPADSFYKYQKYISADNRRGEQKTPTSATKGEKLRNPQKVAENPVSPSPSPSLSPSHSELTQRDELTTHLAAEPRERVVYLPAFEVFWKAYGKFVGKKEAHEHWKLLKPDAVLLATILAAVEGQRGGRKWLEGYQPDAVRWLKGEHWNDIPEAPRPAPAPVARRTSADERMERIQTDGDAAYEIITQMEARKHGRSDLSPTNRLAGGALPADRDERDASRVVDFPRRSIG